MLHPLEVDLTKPVSLVVMLAEATFLDGDNKKKPYFHALKTQMDRQGVTLEDEKK